MADLDNRYDEEDRIEILRARRLKREKERKKRLIKRTVLFAAAAVAIALIVFGTTALLSSNNGGSKEEKVKLVQIKTEGIKHLSFAKLSINGSVGVMSVEEFKEALQNLYNDGYCLVDIYDIAEKDENGNMIYNEEIDFPENKKPLILSERNVSYPSDAREAGVVDKMVLDGDDILCQYTDATGQIHTGDYDIVPIVESFIEEHPDFSYNGARGILSVSGSDGVLGYRTADSVQESQSAQKVAEALKKKGWRFASCGYDQDISYGSEYSIFEDDVNKWKENVGSIVGSSDIIIFPKQTDIGSWRHYSDDNRKYALLKEQGFSYYFINDKTAPYMIQSDDAYFRQTIYEIDSNADLAGIDGSN
ncbi:MAG: hypothetical protein ACOYBH_08500 [Candidatus Alectryocaccobium sp.]|jgi:hypothetical protein